ncbi:ATP-binding protein [Streptomyces sp. ODS05-4]|uniref:ATP-binding protein n=1 Tax=Streptomyces sp. ODS05-4 TaxID=2944939 RepID=UPI00210E945F|nr:ATP-binding protein [Streptomyces sp. ODS05-4]
MKSNLDGFGNTCQQPGVQTYSGTLSLAMRFTSTPRGARLARRLVGVRLHEWGMPYGSGPHEAVVLITAELTANAVRHGHVPGRGFHLALRGTAEPRPVVVRVEVSDTRSERRLPRPGDLPQPDPQSTGGRGLVLVEGLAARWGWHPRADGPGKTVWAEYEIP